jgi:DNA-binding MarR family transcriptional regulator
LSTTRLARRLRSEADMGLSLSMLSALAMIHVHGPLTLGALAEREGVSPPTVTKVVSRLESQDLVDRTVDPTDRRVCRVATTPAGERFLAASRERKNAWLAAHLAAFDEDRRARLAAALDVLEELAAAGEPT